MQRCIKLIKNESKDIYNGMKDFYFKSILFFHFLFIKKSWKVTFYTNILRSTIVFNIDNNQKCFLSSKSAY